MRMRLHDRKVSDAAVHAPGPWRTCVPAWAHSGMQGYRATMEDAVVAAPLHPSGAAHAFALFDGHGGDFAARWAARETPRRLRTLVDALGGPGAADAASLPLAKLLLTMDADLRAHACAWGCGTTAVVLIVTASALTVANLGDSRAVLCRSGSAVAMSSDHKPTDAAERARIVRAGGFVVDARVNGDLALSRALGDFRHKAVRSLPPHEQPVSTEADVFSVARQADDSFALVACDGVWDVMESAEAVDFCANCLELVPHAAADESPAEREAQRVGLMHLCERLIDECIRRGSTDNVSLVLVLLDPNLRPRKLPPRRPPPRPSLRDLLGISIEAPGSLGEPVLAAVDQRRCYRVARSASRLLCSRAAVCIFFLCTMLAATQMKQPRVLTAVGYMDSRQPLRVQPLRPVASREASDFEVGHVVTATVLEEGRGAGLLNVMGHWVQPDEASKQVPERRGIYDGLS